MTAVDVVVPCYNYSRYLRGCVESVLSQRDVDVRVLIIDDKSTDNTPEVGQELAASDPRITYRRHDVNKGLIGTANEGIDWLEAPYWLLLSADDALTPGALARATAVLDAHPEVGMVYGIAEILEGEARQRDLQDSDKLTFQIVSGENFLRQTCQYRNLVPSPCAIVRTSLQNAIGGYVSNLPHTSDMEMWMRIATRASIGVVHEPQGFYRLHTSNMSTEYFGQPVGDRREVISTCREVMEKWGQNNPDFPRWVRDMEHSLARDVLVSASYAYERGEDERRWREMLAFAKEFDPSIWKSFAYWKFLLKRISGRKLIRLFRDPTKIGVNDSWHGEIRYAGWWPEQRD